MSSLDRGSLRIVIAGASTLLGAELRERLVESSLAAADFRLVDEEYAAGTLTEVSGEAALIQPVEESSFHKASFVFFAGTPGFTQTNLQAAQNSGAKVIDLSGGSLGRSGTKVWFSPSQGSDLRSSLYAIPSAAGIIAARLLGALSHAGSSRLSFVFFRPVSEAGRPGIEELESQTSQLLSFQSVGQRVFDSQVAFSLLDRYGAASRQNLSQVRARIREEVAAAVGRNHVQPAIQVLHAPVFYGYSFIALAEHDAHKKPEEVRQVCEEAGFAVAKEREIPMGNLSASDDTAIHLSLPEPDAGQPGTWWFWGVADNIRLPVANAVKLAEMLL